MRNALTGVVVTGALAFVLPACGGGGSATTPTLPTTQQAAAVASPIANQSVTNGSGPTSTMTVTIHVPARTTPSAALVARIHAVYGHKQSMKSVRTMANTSPTASIRTAGAQQHAYALKIQQSTGRSPEFVPSSTMEMEVVVSSGSNVVFDGTATCTSTSCTNTFNGVPVGSGYTVTIYLYDYCSYLIAVGASSNNVAVTAGATTMVPTITLNGVVTYFNVTSNPTNATLFVADQSSPYTFTVGVQALDADMGVITTPGELVDSNFYPITGVSISQSASDVAPSSVLVAPAADLSFSSSTFAYDGTGSEGFVDFIATEVPGSTAVAQSFYTYNSPSGTQNGSLQLATAPVSLYWSPEFSLTPANLAPQITITNQGGTYTTSTLQFPSLTGGYTWPIGLYENNYPSFTGNISFFTSNCSGVIVAPTPMPYQTIADSGVPIGSLTQSQATGSTTPCTLTASDGLGRQAALTIYYDNENITIQSKRAHR